MIGLPIRMRSQVLLLMPSKLLLLLSQLVLLLQQKLQNVIRTTTTSTTSTIHRSPDMRNADIVEIHSFQWSFQGIMTQATATATTRNRRQMTVAWNPRRRGQRTARRIGPVTSSRMELLWREFARKGPSDSEIHEGGGIKVMVYGSAFPVRPVNRICFFLSIWKISSPHLFPPPLKIDRFNTKDNDLCLAKHSISINELRV